MTLQDLGSLGEFVGAIAVVISLIYLAVQVRRNTQQLESNVQALLRAESSAQHEQWSNWRKMQINDPELISVWNRGLKDLQSLNDVEYTQFNMLATELFYIISNVWERQQASVAPSGAWEIGRRSAAAFLEQPGGTAWWSKAKHFFYEHFIEEVDHIGGQGDGNDA
jgi:hypothetical protein